ncbi:unnamed protein product [Ectocarpus fasciculatus]
MTMPLSRIAEQEGDAAGDGFVAADSRNPRAGAPAGHQQQSERQREQARGDDDYPGQQRQLERQPVQAIPPGRGRRAGDTAPGTINSHETVSRPVALLPSCRELWSDHHHSCDARGVPVPVVAAPTGASAAAVVAMPSPRVAPLASAGSIFSTPYSPSATWAGGVDERGEGERAGGGGRVGNERHRNQPRHELLGRKPISAADLYGHDLGLLPSFLPYVASAAAPPAPAAMNNPFPVCSTMDSRDEDAGYAASILSASPWHQPPAAVAYNQGGASTNLAWPRNDSSPGGSPGAVPAGALAFASSLSPTQAPSRA